MNKLLNVIRAISPFQGKGKEKAGKESGSVRSSARSDESRSNAGSETRRKYKEAISGSIKGNSSPANSMKSDYSMPSPSTGSNFDDSSTIASYPTATNRSISNVINRNNIGRPPISYSNQNSNPNLDYDNMIDQKAPFQNANSNRKSNQIDFDLSDVDLFKLLDMFYLKYNRSKRDSIELVLNEYRGDEVELIEGLMRRYKVSNDEIEHFIGKCRIVQRSSNFQANDGNNMYSNNDDDDDDATATTEISLPSYKSSDDDEEFATNIPSNDNISKNSNIAAKLSKSSSINGVRASSRDRGHSEDSDESVGLKDLLKRSNGLDQKNRTIADQMLALKLTEYDSRSPTQQIGADRSMSPTDFTKSNIKENPLVKVVGDNIIYEGVALKNSSVNNNNKKNDNKGKINQFSDNLVAVNDADMENILASGFCPKNAQTFEKILNTPVYRQTANVAKAAVKFKSAIKSPNKFENDENVENKSVKVDFRTGSIGERLKYDYKNLSATKQTNIKVLQGTKQIFIDWVNNRRAMLNKSKLNSSLISNKAKAKPENVSFLNKLREFIKDPTSVNKFQPYKSKTNKRKEKRIWVIWIEKMKKKQKKILSNKKFKLIDNTYDSNNQNRTKSNRSKTSQSSDLTTTPRKALSMSAINDPNNELGQSKLSPSGKPCSNVDPTTLVLNPLSKSNYKINRPQDELGDDDKKPVDLEKEKNAAEKELALTISEGLQTKSMLIESLCRGEALLNLLADILEKTKNNSIVNAGQVIEKFLIKTGFPGEIYNTADENVVGARLLAASKDNKFNKKCIRKYKGRFLPSLFSEINEYNRNDFVSEKSNEDNDKSDSDQSKSESESDDEQQVKIDEVKNMLAKKDLMKMNIEKSELFEFQNLSNNARLAINAAPLFDLSKNSNQLADSVNGSGIRSSSVGTATKKNREVEMNNRSSSNSTIESSKLNSTSKTAHVLSSFNTSISKSHTIDMNDLETISTVLKVNHDLPKYMAYTQGAVNRIAPDTKEVPQITSGGLLSPNRKTIEKIKLGKTPEKFKDNESSSRYLLVTNAIPNLIASSPPTISYPPTSPYHKATLNDSNYVSTNTFELPDKVRQKISSNFNSIKKDSNDDKKFNQVELVIPPPRSVSRNRMSDFVNNSTYSSNAGTGSGVSDIKLINDWKAKLDPKTNKTYYYSPCRRVSTWNIEKYENRTGSHSTSNSATRTESGFRSASPASSVYSTTVPPLPSEEFKSSLGKRSTTPTSLRIHSPTRHDTTIISDKNGDTWIKKLDEASNRFYWYSKTTKKSSWYPPVI